jgi:hypothetical protein
MKNQKSIMIAGLFLTLLTALMMIGCSTENNPVAAVQPGNHETQATSPTPVTPYPTLTDDQISALIPGFTVLKTDERAAGRGEDQLDSQSSLLIRHTIGGTVTHRNNGVQIGAWQLWEDQVVTVSTPNPGIAIVDFYPHPYHFNGCIKMWIDLSYIQLPAGRRWDELAFFYQDTNGQLIRYWGALDLNAHTYSAWPDHFSRYIIAMPER